MSPHVYLGVMLGSGVAVGAVEVGPPVVELGVRYSKVIGVDVVVVVGSAAKRYTSSVHVYIV